MALSATQLTGGGWTSDGIEFSAPYNHADEGLVTVAAAPGTNKRIVLVAYQFVGEGAVGLRFQDTDDEFTGLMDFAANTVLSADSHGRGILAAGANKRLDIYQSAVIQVSGWVRWTVQTKVS